MPIYYFADLADNRARRDPLIFGIDVNVSVVINDSVSCVIDANVRCVSVSSVGGASGSVRTFAVNDSVTKVT